MVRGEHLEVEGAADVLRLPERPLGVEHVHADHVSQKDRAGFGAAAAPQRGRTRGRDREVEQPAGRPEVLIRLTRPNALTSNVPPNVASVRQTWPWVYCPIAFMPH